MKKDSETVKKAFYKRPWFIIVTVIVASGLLGIIFGEPKKSSDTSVSSPHQTQVAATNQPLGWDASMSNAPENSTERADGIIYKARDDVDMATEDEAHTICEDAIRYIADNADDLHASNDIMEKIMYYGTFLEKYIEDNSNAGNISELSDDVRAVYEVGYNAVKAVKYVYRNAESVEDESTKNAVEDVRDALEMLEELD